MRKSISLLVAIGLFLIVTTVAHADLFMSLSGKVVAADNGEPLSGVTLRLISPEKGKIAEAKSNVQGVFIIRDVRKGDYSIWAVSDDPFIVSSSTTVPVTVPDGKNVVGIGVKLQRGGAIKGKVVTSNGKIVSNASILGNGVSATTDAAGNFLLKGVAPGLQTMAAMASSIAAKAFSATSEIGKVVDVGNLVLPVDAASAIRGTVVDSAGSPVSGVIVTATNANAPGAYAMSSNTGSFVITGLSVTKFKLSAVKYGYEQFSLADVNVPSSNLTITLTPSSVPIAGMLEKFTVSNKSAVEKMYLSNVIPASYEGRPGETGSCLDGGWIGTSTDFTAGINVRSLNWSFGGSYSIGGLFCTSSRVDFGFSQHCAYGGLGKESPAAVNLGVSWIAVRDACFVDDILIPKTNGIVFSASGGIYSGGLAIESNNRGVASLTVSVAVGPSFPSLGWFSVDKLTPQKLGLSGSGVGRICSSTLLKSILVEDLDLGI